MVKVSLIARRCVRRIGENLFVSYDFGVITRFKYEVL